MAHDEARVRPETYALDVLIRQSVADVRRAGAESTPGSLLFVGNRHRFFPSMVVQDPVLEPVDKLVWMVICLSRSDADTRSVFPSYDDIARLSSVASTSTISRAINILRVTRWLSLCSVGRDAGGRFVGNVYALHDEPLPLADGLHLDPGYMVFLREATAHSHAQVRRVAAAVLASLEGDTRAGSAARASGNATRRPREAIQTTHQAGERHYFSFEAAANSTLSSSGAPTRSAHRLRNSKPVDRVRYSKPADRIRYSNTVDDPQNSKAVSRSSSNIYKTTTTTTTTPKRKKRPACETVSLEKLILPSRLTDDQHELTARYLAHVPATQRQAVLDELEGRLQAEKRGAKPIYDELRYLNRLCQAAKRGSFHPNLGRRVQAARDRLRRDAKRSQSEAAARERERTARAARAGGTNPLAELRKHLNMPPSPTRK